MSGEEDGKLYLVELAKTGRASCKKCKSNCEKDVIRIAKLVANPWGSGKLKNWFHVDCFFLSLKSQRNPATFESTDDIDGWSLLSDENKELLLAKFEENDITFTAELVSNVQSVDNKQNEPGNQTKLIGKHFNKLSEDNRFRHFQDICDKISNVSSYTAKSAILHKYLTKGSNGKQFEGNLFLWIKLLLPATNKRIYNLQSKQLIKLFARIFRVDADDMMEHLKQGDVSETIRCYFEKSSIIKPVTESTLTLTEVDKFLDALAKLTREDDQTDHFRNICKRCTVDDLKMLIRFIKHDLRINAGPKHILDAVNGKAYETWQTNRDLANVIVKYGDKIHENILTKSPSKVNKTMVQLMCPISPMLAEACKSVDMAIEKCPNGFYSEIKYDGERVQLHKDGDKFVFYSRNLKPVQDHKVKRCKEFILKAFPEANQLVLDSEIILVDTETSQLLPFGSLGVHKKTQFQSAEVCLFVFDCIYYNGEDLTGKTLLERRKILETNMKPIKNHVQLSEYNFIQKRRDLAAMIAKVLEMGLEGLVLKNINGIYEPGKRHWLKVKKDYLCDGKMADSADLVVIGGWYGTGKKGGMLSIFLMGCYDHGTKRWKTVTKVHSGLDDATLNGVQKTLNPLMTPTDPNRIPHWLDCKSAMVPDLIAKNPKVMPVWEIAGAEFTKADGHTANGISIRFPRVQRIREDKQTGDATTMKELVTLFENSKQSIDIKMLMGDIQDDEDNAIVSAGNLFKAELAGPSGSHKRDAGQLKPKKTSIQSESSVKGKPTSNSNKISVSEAPCIILKLQTPTNNDSSKHSKDNIDRIQGKKRKNDEYDAGIKSIKTEENQSGHGLFKDVVLYVPSNVQNIIGKSLIKFIVGDGVLVDCHTDESLIKNCTHALYHDAMIIQGWTALRNKFNPSCRHVKYNWLIDSVQNMRLQPYKSYAVINDAK